MIFSEQDKSLIEKLHQTEDALNKIILGKPEIIRLSLVCFLAGGHLLLDDLPGSGKTTLGKSLASAFNIDFIRVQFTSDLLPSDIIGVSVFDNIKREFEFHKGPVFTNVLLADEINRCSPRTQSSLLEAMDEKQVSVDGVTHTLPPPFFVIATQNPVDMSGTFPLPDSQLDRFLFRLSLGHPSKEDEILLLKQKNIITSASENLIKLEIPWSSQEILYLQNLVKKIHLSDDIALYVYNILEKSRNDNTFRNGLSTRAGIAMVTAAKAMALLEGNTFVKPEDIQGVFHAVSTHRLISAFDIKNDDMLQHLDQLLHSVHV
jgi:MoxR-like ATPase